MNTKRIAEAAQRYMQVVEDIGLAGHDASARRELADAQRELNALVGVALADQPATCPTCDGRTITGPWSCPECGARYDLDEP